MTEVAALRGLVSAEPAIPDFAAVEASIDRLASTLVRRYANNHDCPAAGVGKPPAPTGAVCHHRNHRRDVAAAAELLEILDLNGDPAVPSDYEGPSGYHTFSREEAASWAGKGAMRT